MHDKLCFLPHNDRKTWLQQMKCVKTEINGQEAG